MLGERKSLLLLCWKRHFLTRDLKISRGLIFKSVLKRGAAIFSYCRNAKKPMKLKKN